jgi:cytochrome c oxidase subunit IV
MSGHIVPVKIYVAVFGALIALTLLTTAAAFVDMGRMNTVVALAIAVTKMLLVILFFMHVKYSPGLTRIVVVAGFFWLAILVSLSLADELTRSWSPTAAPWSVLLPFLTGLR